jgi:hypothetical protein
VARCHGIVAPLIAAQAHGENRKVLKTKVVIELFLNLARLLLSDSLPTKQIQTKGVFMTIRKTALTIALAVLFAAGGTAVAQSYGGAADQAPAPAEATTQATALTDETIDTFVDAFVAVQEIREDFTERLHSASDEAEAQAMQQEAQEKMMQAVEESGMSVQEYNEVAMALQNDPELMQQVQEKAADRM